MIERRDYESGDQITRQMAWEDLQQDFLRLRYERWDHIVTDMLVNLWRIAGVSDRDWSQRLGRGTGVLLIFGAAAAIVGFLQ